MALLLVACESVLPLLSQLFILLSKPAEGARGLGMCCTAPPLAPSTFAVEIKGTVVLEVLVGRMGFARDWISGRWPPMLATTVCGTLQRLRCLKVK